MANPFKTLFAAPETDLQANLAPLLQEAYKKHQDQNKDKLLAVAVEIFNVTETTRKNYLAHLQDLRKQEKLAKEKLAKVTRAAVYFGETLNFGPLMEFLNANVYGWCQKLGVSSPDETDKVIPADWKPKES